MIRAIGGDWSKDFRSDEAVFAQTVNGLRMTVDGGPRAGLHAVESSARGLSRSPPSRPPPSVSVEDLEEVECGLRVAARC